MDPSDRAHIYRMRQPWQSIVALLGFCAWIGILPCAFFSRWSVFRWTRKIWPAFARMLKGEPVSQVSVAAWGLTCRFWPLLEVDADWKAVEILPGKGWHRACLKLHRWQGKGYCEFAWLPGGMRVMMAVFEGGCMEDVQIHLGASVQLYQNGRSVLDI